MNIENLIYDFQDAIVDIYENQGLTCLKELENDYVLNDRQILEWYFDIIRLSARNNKIDFDFNKNFNDLLYCLDELLLFTDHLFLYWPYINNPLEDGYMFYDKADYANDQNLAAKRYNMFTDISCQVLYNY